MSNNSSFIGSLPLSTIALSSNDQRLSFVAIGLAVTFLLHLNPLRGDHAMALFMFLTSTSAIFAYMFLLVPIYESLEFSLLGTVYIASTVIITTVLYRLSPLHPLWSFPGPFMNKITSLKLAQIVWSGKRHIVIPDLHKKYGTFVRTGPNTLSINSHTAIAPIYASSAAFPKSSAYTPGRMHGDSLFFIQGLEEHNTRRKIWAPAFAPSVVSGWKPVIERLALELLSCMDIRSSHGAKSLDLSEAITHWTYDVMADLTYGGAGSLDMMKKGDVNDYIEGGKISTILFETLGEVPSLFDLVWYLPTASIARHMEKFAQSLIDARRFGSSGRSDDISSWLLGEHDDKPTNFSSDTLRVESLFAIQAGSDTTSGALIFAFYHLLTHKSTLKRLTQELDEAFADYDKSSIPQDKLANLPYLGAVVNETLRLGTPFPGLPRVVPKEGAMISGKFVPGSTIVGVNPWAQMTSEENFYPDPKVFRPERWLPGGLGPDSRVRRSAMMSFSFGSFSCLGKSLAIQEIRLVLTHVLLKYNLEFAPGWDRRKFEDGIDNMRTTVFNYPLLVTLSSRY